jgi:hypothetical protein
MKIVLFGTLHSELPTINGYDLVDKKLHVVGNKSGSD